MPRTLLLATVVTVGISAASGAAAQTPDPSAPTFARDVAPIFYKHCTVCHRPGEIAPMSLLTYAEARPYVRAIGTEVGRGSMPPWHADPAHGAFANDRRLSDAEKDTILRWVRGGAPEGSTADMPPRPAYADGWTIGKPDAVFELPEDYPVPASGTVDYKYFEVPTSFAEDRWIQAYEIKAGAPSVVHHVLVFARPPKREAPAGAPAAAPSSGERRQGPFTFGPGMEEPEANKAASARQTTPNDRPEPKGDRGAYIGTFAPGQALRVFEPGSAMRLPAGATLIFQMHYTANGKAVTDRSKIGFVFAKQRPTRETMTAALMNANFTLPAGAPDTRVDAQVTLNRDTTLWSLFLHTHTRGKRWEARVLYPDGRSDLVLAVPRYDFNWQTDYIFKEPLTLPKGTVLRTSAWYDNSAANKSNPDPKADVHWGEQTWEEMQFTAFTFTLDPRPATTSAGAAP